MVVRRRRDITMDVTLFADGAKIYKLMDERCEEALEKLEKVLKEKINMSVRIEIEKRGKQED